jgi:hypothetical protein
MPVAAAEPSRNDPPPIGRGTGKLAHTVLPQANAYAMMGRRAAAARDRNQARQPQFSGATGSRLS